VVVEEVDDDVEVEDADVVDLDCVMDCAACFFRDSRRVVRSVGVIVVLRLGTCALVVVVMVEVVVVVVVLFRLHNWFGFRRVSRRCRCGRRRVVAAAILDIMVWW